MRVQTGSSERKVTFFYQDKSKEYADPGHIKNLAIGIKETDTNHEFVRSTDFDRKNQSKITRKTSNGTKYILYHYGAVEGWFPHQFEKISQCQVSDCVLTANHTLLGSHGNFDAVVVGNPLYDIARDKTRYSK